MTNEPVRYGEDVKELAFACYVQADRNISRATMLLRARLDGEPCPDRSVVSRWAKENSWALKATEAIAERFPYLQVEHAARLVEMADHALDTYKAALFGELDHLPLGAQRLRIEVAKHVLDMRGLGTSGAKYGNGEMPMLPPPPGDGNEGGSTPQERQRRRLEGES